MIEITNLLYWISTGLLIPVVVLLLVIFVRALIMSGGFVGMYIGRTKFRRELSEALKELKLGNNEKLISLTKSPGNLAFSSTLEDILHVPDKLVAEKEIIDFETACEKDLAKAKSTSRLGPMLGLMGTLIPMGPALVGLAAGDIASMAQNMQVAFSTTVVGLFAGALGYVLQLIKQRWYIEDLQDLEFVYNLRFQDRTTKKEKYVEEEAYASR